MATQTGDKSKIREKKINLAALMKLDGFAKDILDTASSVAHYQFDPTTEKWEKTEFEGSLFVYSRIEHGTEVAFLIMNRLKKENFHITIKSTMEFKPQDPFLLCRTPNEIIGIWFYNSAECARISALLSRIAELADDEAQLKEEIEEALDEINKIEKPKVDVLKLFKKAKQEYDKKQGSREHLNKSASMPKLLHAGQKQPVLLKRTNSFPEGVDEDISEEEEEGITMLSRGKNKSFTSLLKSLQHSRSKDGKSRARTLSYGESANTEPSSEFKNNARKLNGSMAGDLAFTQDSVGAEQRQKGLPKPQIIDVAKLEASVLLSQGSAGSRSREGKNAEPPDDSAPSQEFHTPVKDTSNIAARSGPMLLTPANITPTRAGNAKPGLGGKGRGKGLAAVFDMSEIQASHTRKISQGQAVPTGPVLKSAGEPQKEPRKETNFAMKFPDPPTTGPAMSLMSPMQFKALRKTNVPQDSFDTPEISQLNKQQFRDAFITLLQTDDSFVDKLHDSYLSLGSKR